MSLQCSFFFYFKLKHTFLKFQTVPPQSSSRIQVKRFTVGEFVIGGSDYSLDSYRSRLDFFSFSVRYLSSPIEKSFDRNTLGEIQKGCFKAEYQNQACKYFIVSNFMCLVIWKESKGVVFQRSMNIFLWVVFENPLLLAGGMENAVNPSLHILGLCWTFAECFSSSSLPKRLNKLGWDSAFKDGTRFRHRRTDGAYCQCLSSL